jgi:hypothetical protein
MHRKREHLLNQIQSQAKQIENLLLRTVIRGCLIISSLSFRSHLTPTLKTASTTIQIAVIPAETDHLDQSAQ